MLKEYFSKGKVLAKELSLYRTLSESDSLDLHVAEKIVCETRIAYHSLDGKKIYRDQSALIKIINSSLSKDAWNNFIPNYKSLATISHIFNKSTPVKQRVLYEEKVIRNLSDNPALEVEDLETVDNIVYKKFVEKFNDKYKNLREEERKLLLAALEARFQKMLAMQLAVFQGTITLGQVSADAWVGRHTTQSIKLARDEEEIAVEAIKALTLLKEEGSSVAFPEAVIELREDMLVVSRRLEESKVGKLTRAIEKDIIESLEEMIDALQKELEKSEDEKKEQEQKKQQQQD